MCSKPPLLFGFSFFLLFFSYFLNLSLACFDGWLDLAVALLLGRSLTGENWEGKLTGNGAIGWPILFLGG